MEPTTHSSKTIYYIIGGLALAGVAFFALNVYQTKVTAPKAPEKQSPDMSNNDAMMQKLDDKNIPKENTGMMQATEYTVIYNNTGFTPNTIEVPVGSKVRFVNNSKVDMWVASAMHPTHGLLPGFDELKGDAKGSSYEYTFTKAGSWKYHDHLKPELRGLVIVK